MVTQRWRRTLTLPDTPQDATRNDNKIQLCQPTMPKNRAVGIVGVRLFAARASKVLTREEYWQHCQDEQARVKRDIEVNLVEERERSIEDKPNDQSEHDTIPRPSLFLIEWTARNISYEDSPTRDSCTPNSINPLLELFGSITDRVRTPESRVNLAIEQIKERCSTDERHYNSENGDD